MTAYRQASGRARVAPSGEEALARAASSNSGKSTRAPAKKSAAQPAAKPGENGENLALHSLQESLEESRRFKASADELLTFYERMLLIRRFEEKAGQLYGLGLI